MPPWLETGKDLLPYMAEILSGLGLPPDRIRILERPIRFRHLLIPVQSWGFSWDRQAWDAHLGCDSRELMRSLLTSYKAPAGPEGEAAPTKLYVTRSGLPLNMGRLIGDVMVDQLLASAGYAIFHPERHDIAAQIRVYSQARDIVFMDDSSLYLLWFAPLQPGARITAPVERGTVDRDPYGPARPTAREGPNAGNNPTTTCCGCLTPTPSPARPAHIPVMPQASGLARKGAVVSELNPAPEN